MPDGKHKFLFLANTDWYLFNFRLELAKHLRDHGHEVVMVAPPDKHWKRIEAEGFRFIPVSMQRESTRLLSELPVPFRLLRIYLRERPTIAHHFTLKCVVYGSIAARFSRTTAVVNAITGLGFTYLSEGPRARFLRPILNRLLNLACNARQTLTILQNPDDLKLIQLALRTGGAKLRLIPGSGVDINRFYPRNETTTDSGADTSPPLVLLIGRLLYEKGVPEFVEVARIVRKQMPHVRFVIAGGPDPGNPGSIGDTTIEKWKAEGDVEFLGHVEDMHKVLQQATVVTLPSHGEGVPRSLIEAAACGKPLLATDVPGCREIVQHQDNGYLVPLGSIALFAERLEQMLTDPEALKRMGERSRELAVERFSNATVFQDTMAVYDELLGDRGR